MEPSQASSTLTEGPWGRGGLAAAEESIKLIPKIRPSTTPGLPDYVKYVGHKALSLSAPGAENAHWDFDFVASPHTRQSSFFRVAGRPMADHFLGFYHTAIIAYGQTGSGKTHTMLGNLPSDWAARSLSSGCFEEMPREAGLIPRVLSYIFQRIAAESQGDQTQKQPASVRQLPLPPPASQQANTTPVTERARTRGRSGIPTLGGVTPRDGTPRQATAHGGGCLTPSAVPPLGTPEPIHGHKPSSGPSVPSSVLPRTKSTSTVRTEYLIKASMVQIYQEVVTDLLNPRPTRLQIRESMRDGVVVVGLSEVRVCNAPEALQLLHVGTSHRAVAETATNPVSSRSHCILTLHMEAKDMLDTGIARIRRSRLQLVDLAGSERSSKGADYGSARQKEANSINKSLSTLGLVISRLTDRTRSQGPVPYRDSKLTFLLQDCLGGNAKTLMIANLNPSPTCANETNMTLGFALRAKRVRNQAVVNEDHQGDAVVLQGEVRRLREELSIFRTLHAKDKPPQGIEELSVWRDQAAARVSQLHQALQLNGELEEKLAAMETAYSRLRMEHAAYAEQCEAERFEMSTLQTTVEMDRDEIHELREKLQAMDEELQASFREQSDARHEHADAVQQNLELHDQCMQLMGLLQAYQKASPEGDEAQQGQDDYHSADRNDENEYEDMELPTSAQVTADMQAAWQQDYTALALAYSQLKDSHAALVEQNRQLLLQLEAAASTLEAASIKITTPEEGRADATLQRRHHRYHLTDSCLISGCLEAVMEVADECFDDDIAEGSPDQIPLALSAPRESLSLSEQVRLASPALTSGHYGRDADSGSSGGNTRPSPPPPSPRAPRDADEQRRSAPVSHIRRRWRRQGRRVETSDMGTDAAADRKSHIDLGCYDPLSSHRSCDSAPPTYRLTNVRPLGISRAAYSAREVEFIGSARHEDGDDAAESRSLGTLIRVNPLFDCRANSGEARPNTSDASEVEERDGGAEVTSEQVGQKSSGSESIVCELPMPPDENITQASPWSRDARQSLKDCDSTAGVVQEGVDVEAGTEVSSARDMSLQEGGVQCPDAVALPAAAHLPDRGPTLHHEHSLMTTPCSWLPRSYTGAETADQECDIKTATSSCDYAADCRTQDLSSPNATVGKLNDRVMTSVDANHSTLKDGQRDVSRAAHFRLNRCSPLLPTSVHEAQENYSPSYDSKTAMPLASTSCLNPQHPQAASSRAQSPCVTGVAAPPTQVLRLSQSTSRNTGDHSRTVKCTAMTTALSPSASTYTAMVCDQREAGLPNSDCAAGGVSNRSATGSPTVFKRAGPSWAREDQLAENVVQLEDELVRRLEGERELRIKLQAAQTERQSAVSQAADLLNLNNAMAEWIAEREERLRGFQDVLTRVYSEVKSMLRQGRQEAETPPHEKHKLEPGSTSPPVLSTGVPNSAAADRDSAQAEPATISPTERQRIIQSFEAAAGSLFSFGSGSLPKDLIRSLPSSEVAAASPPTSQGSHPVDCPVSSPPGNMAGPAQVDAPTSALMTDVLLLLAKLKDGLLERDQHVEVLEGELGEARARLQRMEQEMQKLLKTWQHGLISPVAGDEMTPVEVVADVDAGLATTTAMKEEAEAGCVTKCTSTAPPSPAGSKSDSHYSVPWSASLDAPCQPFVNESSMQAEALLQEQLQARDCQVFEVLERNVQLEAALAERDSRVADLQSQATHLVNSLQTQLWLRNSQITELKRNIEHLDSAMQRATAEGVRLQQQSTKAEQMCQRYALELQGCERREELLMNKLRTMEMSLIHRGQEIEQLRNELASAADELCGMRAKAITAEVDAAQARQMASSLQDQLEDLRRRIGLVQHPPVFAHQQASMCGPAHYSVSTIHPSRSSAGGAHPASWHQGGPGPQLPYMYTSRSDGSTVAGPSTAYQMFGPPPHVDYGRMGEMGGMPHGAKPLGQPSRTSTYSQAGPPPAPPKPGPGNGYSKGGGGRVPAPASTAGPGAGLDHSTANKGTWVQRFLCRKGASIDGGPGQEAHVAILTPSKWRTKGMTGIVLRQWVGNAAGKNASRKAG